MRSYLPELFALPLYPLLYLQGKRTRRVTLRLPEAGGPDRGMAYPPDGQPSLAPALRLLCLGESPVAGVGVATHEQAISGQLARQLAQDRQATVSWQALGRNGADLAQALEHLVPQLPASTPAIDIVLIAFGVNDTTAFRPAARYRAELAQLIQAVQAKVAPTQIILSGVPPIHAFPALPQPLRFVLGCKARVLDQVARQVADSFANVHYVAMQLDSGDPALMAVDGYHPSEKGVHAWAVQLSQAIRLSIGQWGPKK